MGPPAVPPSKTSRPSLAGGLGVANRSTAPTSRSTSSRQSLAPKTRVGSSTGRIGSIGSQISSGNASEGSGQDGSEDDRGATPIKSDHSSSKPASPLLTRAVAAERSQPSPASSRSQSSPMTNRGAVTSTAASREIEDLKTKLRLMEKKRMEDRDKLKALEKVQADKDKFEVIIQKLQTKFQPQQQELTELRKQLKESEARHESIEDLKQDHEISLEMATLDREMAEETAEALKTELEALKAKIEELELEVDVLREENQELNADLTPEQKQSQNYLQLANERDRLRDAVQMLRDMTKQQQGELLEQIKELETDLTDFNSIKEHHEIAKEKLATSEALVEDLRQQLDNALGAEDMIEDLTERNMTMNERIEELKATIEDLESLKELNDELEINHIEAEKEMQEELDFKDSVISEQVRRATQQDQAMEDMEYTLSRFRELVTSLQSDIADMKASHAVDETESAQLDDRSRQMMDLNMKLQVVQTKALVKTIDLELRRLEAQEASEHLAIVQMFLPEAYHADRDSVLALLRFKRVGFKASLLHGFVKERANGPVVNGHEDDLFSACDVLDKLTWVSTMCDRFVNAIGLCTVDEFAKFEGALYELEPVERALNGWIDGLRRDDLKEKQCATELQRTIALMSHLAELHIPEGLANYAGDIHMRAVIIQSQLESSAVAFSILKTMVLNCIPSQGSEDELAQHFVRKADSVISQARGAKVIVSKAVRALEDLKTRSLSLLPDTSQQFEQCEDLTRDLAKYARQVGEDLFALLHEEGRAEPYTYLEVQSVAYRTTMQLLSSSDSDLFSTFSNRLKTLHSGLLDLATLSSDLEIVQEFDKTTSPWVIRSNELRSSRTVSVDVEEEMRRLKNDNHERARIIALRDQTLEESTVKIELLESRMRDANKKNEKITELEKKIESAKRKEVELIESIETQNRELTAMEVDREKWKKVAEDAKALGIASSGTKAGQERAVATAREMEALKSEISNLQAAVRFLREDNSRTRSSLAISLDWLEAPLSKPKSRNSQRRDLVTAEGTEVFTELLKLTATSKIFDLATLPEDRLSWKPAKTTPQYHVARQKENFEAWNGWKQSVIQKGKILTERSGNARSEKTRGAIAAKIELRLPDVDVKAFGNGAREVEIVNSDEFDGLRSKLGFV